MRKKMARGSESMTPEEAYKILNGEIIYKGGRNNGKRFAMSELNRVINEALEKQMPKKPVIVTIQNVNYPTCPTCGRVLWGKEYYCATCGQRVNRYE